MKQQKAIIKLNALEQITLTRMTGSSPTMNGNAARLDSSIDHGRKGSRTDAAFNGIESLVLALFEANVPMDAKIRKAITTAYDAVYNQYVY
jgi:hypothetical protein